MFTLYRFQVIMEQSEHVWGEKRDIDPVTLSTLNGINHQLVDVRYRKGSWITLRKSHRVLVEDAHVHAN